MTQNCFSYNCFSVVQNIFVQAFVCGKKATRVFSQFPLSGKLRRSLDELAKSFGTVGFPCAQGPGVMGKDGKQADASFFVSLTVGISAYFYLKICIYIYIIYIYILYLYTHAPYWYCYLSLYVWTFGTTGLLFRLLLIGGHRAKQLSSLVTTAKWKGTNRFLCQSWGHFLRDMRFFEYLPKGYEFFFFF